MCVGGVGVCVNMTSLKCHFDATFTSYQNLYRYHYKILGEGLVSKLQKIPSADKGYF